MKAEPKAYDLASNLSAYEEGDLATEGIIGLFQYLVDTGLAWTFQGHYGRVATDLIREGLVTRPAGQVDAWGRSDK